MDERKSDLVAKVPQVTLLFWIIKILATTLGETRRCRHHVVAWRK